MIKIELRELSIYDGYDILEMIKEIGPGENGFMNDGLELAECDFEGYLVKNISTSKGVGLEPGFVPQTKYWLHIDGRPVGIGKLRHYLNEKLLKRGGHIGYCIRPADRGKGYGNIMLAEMLKKAKEHKIDRALVTCSETNIPSRRIIEFNGGKMESAENGECRFWIQIS